MRKFVVVLALAEHLCLAGLRLDLAQRTLTLSKAKLESVVVEDRVLQTFDGILSGCYGVELDETEAAGSLRIVSFAYNLDGDYFATIVDIFEALREELLKLHLSRPEVQVLHEDSALAIVCVTLVREHLLSGLVLLGDGLLTDETLRSKLQIYRHNIIHLVVGKVLESILCL